MSTKQLADISSRGLQSRAHQIWRYRWLYILVLPAVVTVIIFNYLPIYGLTVAFRNFNASLGVFRSPWAEPLTYNFWFLQDREFWYVMGNTVRIAVLKFVFGWPAPIIFALLLNEISHSGFKRTVQTVSYLPHFLSWVIVASVIYRILSFEAYSPINTIRAWFDLAPVALMGDQNFFRPLVVISAIYKEVGWETIIYLAAISGINTELYEQAEIDGARRLRQAWSITLPGMLPIIAILLVLQIPSILQAGLDQIYNLANASTRRVAYITDIYVIRMGLMMGQYAVATAMGLIFSVVGFALTLIANRISKGSVGHGIW